MMELYHYTDKETANKIAKTRRILQSRRGPGALDAAFGDGVYATDLHPDEHSVNDIAYKNWDDDTLPQKKIDEGKMDAVIVTRVEKSRVSNKHKERHVFLIEGDIKSKNIKGYLVKDESGKYVDSETLGK